MSRTRVLLVDDHALFRRGLMDFLAKEDDIEVVGEASNAAEALEKAQTLSPHVVFMDVNMPDVGGAEAVARLKKQHPEMKVIMLTVSENREALFQAMAAGAMGYVLKTDAPSKILEAFRQVSEGWVVVSPAMSPLLLKYLSEQHGRPSHAVPDSAKERTLGLTPREREVLQLIARGYTNMEIAAELVVSPDTVKTHVRNVLEKLHIDSKRKVVSWAGQGGIQGLADTDA